MWIFSFVFNSTASEIAYAVRTGKKVHYLVSPAEKRCPCCGQYYFQEKSAFEICPVCGWEDDPLQRREEDFAGGANKISLREAREGVARSLKGGGQS